MKEGDFESKLRKQMEGFEMEPPADLWQQIEEKVVQGAVNAGPTTKRPAWVVWMRRMAAAAVLLLMIGGGTMVLRNSQVDKVAGALSESNEPVSMQSVMEKPVAEEPQVESPSDIPSHALAVNTVRRRGSVNPSEPLPTTAGEELADGETEPVAQVPDNMPAPHEEEKSQEGKASENENNKMISTPRHQPSMLVADDDIYPVREQKRGKVALAFYAQNTFGDRSGHLEQVLMSGPNLMAYCASENYCFNDGISGAKSDMPTVYDDRFMEHTVCHYPLKYGLSVEFPLAPRWSLQTGVVYQKLQTDLVQTVNTTDVVTEKFYHYVGVPVRISWQAWQYNRLTVYAVAGGEMDVNVKARMRMEDLEGSISRDRMQLSAEAGVGLQFDILPQIGVFAEPALRYCFDNGSQADTYFKDKPLNVSMQIGIRLRK